VTRTDRIHLAYTLTFLTPFHFGTGLRKGLLDRTVVRDSGEYLYVPGSTIKGVVREHCERLARLYQDDKSDVDARIQVVDLYDEKKALWGLSQAISMVTRIFGSQQQPGHLFFDDAHQSEQGQVETEVYTQVRLDRPTHTSVPGALFTSEFGIRGFTFEGSIDGWLECTPISDADNSPTYSLLLLLAGLRLLDAIGGNKSTGKGRCNCEITMLTVNGKQQGQWKAWFAEIGALDNYAASTQEEVQG
jgi:CRISPR/Cas system CSM-associated protein Csm3 (group 7 of RAMP superfamily)